MLNFIPALATTCHMPLGARAVFTLTNAADLDLKTTTVQVWTNLGGDWRGFDLHPVPPEADPPPSSWHLRLAPHAQPPASSVPQSNDPVSRRVYQARITPQQQGSFSYTYRLRNHLTGAVEWLGDEYNNGTWVIDADSESPSSGMSCLDGAQARAWTQPSSHVIARFAASHAVYGWAITIRSSHVQRSAPPHLAQLGTVPTQTHAHFPPSANLHISASNLLVGRSSHLVTTLAPEASLPMTTLTFSCYSRHVGTRHCVCRETVWLSTPTATRLLCAPAAKFKAFGAATDPCCRTSSTSQRRLTSSY